MKLAVAAIGQLRRGPEKDLIDEYTTRIRAIGPAQGVTQFHIAEHEAPKTLDATRRQSREGEWLRNTSEKAHVRIVLDEQGKQLSSVDFARNFEKWRDQGSGDVAFLIGGADGHMTQTLSTATFRLSLGAMTWPHMLARTMLCEQIYRALSILSGHPYHRA